MDEMVVPVSGFYRHYKHDPKGTPYNYMYEIIGCARNTEDKTFSVLYRPLYENDWMKPAILNARPLEMFMESVVVNSQAMSRFEMITDPELIAKLTVAKEALYS